MQWLTIAKYIGIAVLALVIGWAIYAGIIRPVVKPNPSTANQAEVIYNYTIQPRSTFGCSAFLIRREQDDKQEIKVATPVSSTPVSSGGNVVPDGGIGELPKTS